MRTLLLCLLLQTCALAQTPDKIKVPSQYRNIIRIMPLRLIDISHPGVELQYERLLTGRWLAQASGAFLYIGGHRAALAVKYIFTTSDAERFYGSAEIGAARTRYSKTGFFTNRADTSYTYYEEDFSINRQTQFLNFRIGDMHSFGRVSLDFSVGLGVKRKVVTHHDRSQPDDSFGRFQFPNPNYWLDSEFNGYTVNFPVAISIGYLF